MNTALQVAVTAWQLGTDARDLARQAEIAESLGFHSFWLPENHFGNERSIPSPLMLLAAAAATTQHIRLGSTSYLLPIRHPLQAAEEVAVLDRLSGGRVILGVGRGTQDAMFRAFAVNPRDKRKRFEKNLAIMIDAWQGRPVTEDGETVTLAPRPLQTPHPPVWVAAFGPLAIKQAATLGLPYLASPVETMAQLVDNYIRHRDLAAGAGRPAVDTVPVMRTVYVGDRKRDIDTVRATLNAAANPAMRDPEAKVEDWSIVGDRHYVADKVAEYREAVGMTHLIARGRIPGRADDTWVACLERLAAIASPRS